MQYIEASHFGGPEVLQLKEKATPRPGEGALLIEVRAAGVNYADIMARAGFYPSVPKAPFLPGFEIAGVVTEIGAGVDGFKLGDHVAAITLGGGGYATHAVIPAATAIPLPRDLDPALGVAILVQGLTARLLLEEARVKAGDTVLVSAAAGGVGSIAVQIAKAMNVKVIGLASTSKLDVVRSLGAEHVLDYNQPGWSSGAVKILGGHGVQAYLDSDGDLATEAFPLLGHGAQWIIFGVRSTRQMPMPVEHLWPMIEKNITLRGFNLEGSLQHVPRALGDLFKWVAEGTIKLQIKKYPLQDAAAVHEFFAARKSTGKVVLIPTQ
jgi:NADPH2:quinone reductase